MPDRIGPTRPVVCQQRRWGALIETVTDCDPPGQLACTLGNGDDASRVRFKLTQAGDDVLLQIMHGRLRSRKGSLSDPAG